MKFPPALWLFSVLLCVGPSLLPAQTPAPANTPATDIETNIPFWDCSLPGGSYTVALAKISVVSVHEFLLPGGKVTEVNIVTEGAALARFYHMEPSHPGSGTAAAETARNRLNELANTAADKTGTERAWEKVQKDYPLATHAHTIEYRLQDKASLMALHASARQAWLNGKGRIFTKS